MCKFAEFHTPVLSDALSPSLKTLMAVPRHALRVTVHRDDAESPTRTYYLAGSSVDQQQTWLAAISEVIAQLAAPAAPAPAPIAQPAAPAAALITAAAAGETEAGLLEARFQVLTTGATEWQQGQLTLYPDGRIVLGLGRLQSKREVVLGADAECHSVPSDDISLRGQVPPHALILRAQDAKGEPQAFYLAASSAGDKDAWLAAVGKVLADPMRPRLCSRSQWRNDQSVVGCMACGQPFTVFVRRHHCRICGNIFCAVCTDRILVGQRSCRACHDTQQRNHPSRRSLRPSARASMALKRPGAVVHPKPVLTLTPAQVIAVVGLQARVPGASSPSEFWSLLARKEVLSRDIPRDRWDTVSFTNPAMDKGTSRTAKASLFPFEEVAAFDSAFFGINPDEANRMDPQQRLALMAVKDALDNAGIDVTDLPPGSRVGVYVGIMNFDFGVLGTRETQVRNKIK